MKLCCTLPPRMIECTVPKQRASTPPAWREQRFDVAAMLTLALFLSQRTKTVLTQYANDLDAASRIANRVPLVSKLQKHDPYIRLPSNKDHRVVPVRECLRRANKEVPCPKPPRHSNG